MTRRLGRRSGAAAALVTALLTLGAAPPARAAADSGPSISIDQPAAGSTSDSSSVTFAGSATGDMALYSMKDVVLSAGGQTSPAISCSGSPCPFTWKATFTSNGPYTLEVRATETALLLGSPVAGTSTRAFSVAAPPHKPVLDPPKVTDGRTVELSWSRNTEPDMLYYAVFRKDPGSSKFLQVGGRVAQPSSGKSVTFTDTTTTFSGGDFAYQVVAVRKGATASGETSSDPSGTASATVPPPPTSTTGSVPGGGAPGGGPASTAAPGPPAGVDLSGFLSSRSAPVAVAPITIPDPPDPGFANTLPFGARPPGDDVEDGAGQDAAVAPAHNNRSTSIVSGGSAGRPLVPVAAGLILLMLAMHMRTLNRRLKPADSAELPVDLGPPGPPSAGRRRERARPPAREPAVAPEPEPEPVAVAEPPVPDSGPATQFYDVAQDSEWAAAPDPYPGVRIRPGPSSPSSPSSPSPSLEAEPATRRPARPGRSRPTPRPSPAAPAPPDRLAPRRGSATVRAEPAGRSVPVPGPEAGTPEPVTRPAAPTPRQEPTATGAPAQPAAQEQWKPPADLLYELEPQPAERSDGPASGATAGAPPAPADGADHWVERPDEHEPTALSAVAPPEPDDAGGGRVAAGAGPTAAVLAEPGPEPESIEPPPDPGRIEVVEMVSPTRRRLARAGSR